MFDEYIDKLKDEIINTTCELIRIPSVYAKSNSPKEPFGKNTRLALEYVLDLGKKLGFRTKNIDGYCGYIEFGEGSKLIGIIGHLDVVPEGDGWSYPPFDAVIDNGKIYGRGAIDDKGPVVASLYAMKAVMDNYKLDNRVRLILGINEERDWECIKHYKEKEEIPSIGFSPDADFPCIYAEKSLLNVFLTSHCLENSPICIDTIDIGDNAINVVPKFCKILLKVDTERQDINEIISYLNETIQEGSFDILVKQKYEDKIELISNGISAHSAHPDLGKNAISPILIILNKLFKQYNIPNSLLNWFTRYIGMEFTGESLDINYKDESGCLTLNVAQVYLENNTLKIGMNLRIPIGTAISTVKDKFNQLLNNTNISCTFSGQKDGLYIPKDDVLVTTLCNIFNKKTGLNETPIAIGGATYARAFPNHISFGANMPHNPDMCHQKDEFISIDNLILSCKIYAEAIYELAK